MTRLYALARSTAAAIAALLLLVAPRGQATRSDGSATIDMASTRLPPRGSTARETAR